MPGRLKLLHFDDLDVEACEDEDADSLGSFNPSTDTAFCWMITAHDPAFTGLRFMNKYFLEAENFHLTFLIECTYFLLAYYDAKLKPSGDEHGPLREATPDKVNLVQTESINVPSSPPLNCISVPPPRQSIGPRCNAGCNGDAPTLLP